MAATRTPPGKWIEAGLRALAEGGPEAVRIESLAQSLGVTKGGFYWHFDDRRALLEAILDAWERLVFEEPVARLEEAGCDARDSLRLLSSLAVEEVLEIDLAVRDWARRDRAVAARLRRIDNRRMEYLRSQVAQFCPDPDEVEVRCMLAFSIWIGNHFIAADHGERSRAEVMGLALERLLA